MVRVFDWERGEFLIGNVYIHYLLCVVWVFDWEGYPPGEPAGTLFDWRGSVVLLAVEDALAGDDGVFVDSAEAGDAVVAFAVGLAELFEDFWVVFAVFGGGLAVAHLAAYLAAVADVFLFAGVEAVFDVLALHFGHGAEDGDEDHEEGVRLSVGLEDGELLFLKIDVDVGVLAVEDVVQYVFDVAAQAGELADEDDVDLLCCGVDEALVEDGSVNALFGAGDFFGVGADDLDVVGLGVAGEVVNLALGVLAVAEGGDAGVDYGFFHVVYCLRFTVYGFFDCGS